MLPHRECTTDRMVYVDCHRDCRITGVIYINGMAMSRGVFFHKKMSAAQALDIVGARI